MDTFEQILSNHEEKYNNSLMNFTQVFNVHGFADFNA